MQLCLYLQGGQLVYEVSGLGNDASPMALTADGRVLLAGTSRGSVISIPWPKDPAAAGQQQLQAARGDAGAQSMGGFAAMQADNMQGSKHSNVVGTAAPINAQQQNLHAGLLKHLTVQVESGSSGFSSPRGSAIVSDSKTPKMPADSLSAKSPRACKTPHSARTPSKQAASTDSPPLSSFGQQQQQQGQSGVEQRPSQAIANGEGGDAAGSHQGFKEYRMHSARITAIKVLHTAGVMFTAR